MLLEATDNVGDAVERPIEIVAGNDQRGRQTNNRLMCLFRQHAARQEMFAHGAGIGKARLDFDAGEKTKPAHFLDRGALNRRESLQHVRAEIATALDEAFLLDDAQRDESDRSRQRVAAEGRAMRARREYIHELARAEEG